MVRVEKGRKYIVKNIIKGFKRLYRYEIFHYAVCDITLSLIKKLYLKLSGNKDVSVYPSEDDDDDKKKKIKIVKDDNNDDNGNKSKKGIKVVVIDDDGDDKKKKKGTKVVISDDDDKKKKKGTKVVIDIEEEEKKRIIEENINIPKDDNNSPLFFRLPSRDSIYSTRETEKKVKKLSIVKIKSSSSTTDTFQLPSSTHNPNRSFRPPNHTASSLPGSIE